MVTNPSITASMSERERERERENLFAKIINNNIGGFIANRPIKSFEAILRGVLPPLKF